MNRIRQQPLTAALAFIAIGFLLVILAVNLTAAQPSLEGKTWTLTAWNSPARSDVPLANTSLTLKFTSRTVMGEAGCNQYRAPYEQNGNTLSIWSPATSRKRCPANVMNQEQLYLAALQGIQHYQIDEAGQLQVEYITEQGSGLMTFDPQL